VIEVRELRPDELARVDDVLPLHRLDQADSTYLVAWNGTEPVGHVNVGWSRSKLDAPALGDMFVLPDRRNGGVGTALVYEAERLIASRGHRRISLSVAETNLGARRLYERLGFEPADVPPERVCGTIMIRGEPLEVDETLVYYVKPVDSTAPSSS
jgi:GNAT superfamily N-acetyltransferase